METRALETAARNLQISIVLGDSSIKNTQALLSLL
jgi:hypothetical protein